MQACHKRARANISAGWEWKKKDSSCGYIRDHLEVNFALSVRTRTGNIFYRAQNKNKVHTKPVGTFTSKQLKKGNRVGATSLQRCPSGTASLAARNVRDTTNCSGRAQCSPVIWLHVYNRLWPVTDREPATLPADNHVWDSDNTKMTAEPLISITSGADRVNPTVPFTRTITC